MSDIPKKRKLNIQKIVLDVSCGYSAIVAAFFIDDALYFRGMVDLAYKNIVTHKATSYKAHYDSIEAAMVPVGRRDAKYRYYALTEMIERMEGKGLIQVKLPTRRGIGKSFKLTNLKHCKSLYKLAFSSIKPLVNADVMVQGKFSKSDAAQQLISNLEKVAFHAYSITPKP